MPKPETIRAARRNDRCRHVLRAKKFFEIARDAGVAASPAW